MKRVALVASEKREFDGVLRRFGPGTAAELPVAYSRRLVAGEAEWLLVADGQGAKAAVRACAAIPEWERLDAVGSIGFAGGLRPEWQLGDVVWGAEVRDRVSGEVFSCWIPEGVSARAGCVLSAERVIRHAAEKQRLGAEGADVVEMEAAAVARAWRERAPGRARPRFFVVKAVSDTCDEDLVFDFDRARRPNGSIRAASVLAQALHRPLVRLPQLSKLARAARLASDQLGAALAAVFSTVRGEGAH
jgi:nucleoside phosphorylase